MTRLISCALVLDDNGYAIHIIPCDAPDEGLQGNVVMAQIDVDRISDVIHYDNGVIEYTPTPAEEVIPNVSETDVLGEEVVYMKMTITEQADLIDALGKELAAIKLKGVK